MRPRSFVLAIATAFVVLGPSSACSNKEDTHDNSGSMQLDGRSFLLHTAVGFSPIAGTKIAVRFTDGELSFSAGCNQHLGPYAISNGRLVMHGMSSTEMGCATGLNAQDAWLADFFLDGPTVALNGDTLTFSSGDVILTFRDREVADPDRTLTGPTWTVDTIITGTAASTVIATVGEPTIVFSNDGSVQVTTRCSTGGGNYSATASQLAFVSVKFTESVCADTAAQTQLTHLATVFADGTATYRIDAARLTIERDSLGIGALASQ